MQFLIIDAVWTGSSRVDCLPETVGREVGACWPFITAKFAPVHVRLLPGKRALAGRSHLCARRRSCSFRCSSRACPTRASNAILFFGVFPVVGFFLLVGGVFGLPHVETRLWGGLLVTLVISFTGIICSLPLGILLALGRRSELPIIRMLCVVFIEFWRGVPLITVLFFATYMLPLFLPGSWKIDGAAARADRRGAVLRRPTWRRSCAADCRRSRAGNSRARWRSGLGYWRMMGLVVLPQALKLVIPGIVNSFISLFKDTTLVLIVAIFDLLGQLRAAFADPNWATPVTLFTGFAFAGMIYFLVSFGMSRYALFMERRLEHRARSADDMVDDRDQAAIKQDRPERRPPLRARHAHDPQRGRGRDRRPEQMVRRTSTCCATSTSRSCAASASSSAARRAAASRRCCAASTASRSWQRGRVIVDGMELTDDLKKIDEVRREVGMVFQQFNLFPHLTVLENCTLAPIWVRKMPQEGGRGARAALSRARAHPRAGRQVSGAALRRPAAAGRDRAGALHAAQDHAVRRADLGARPGDGQGGARHHGRRSRSTA